LSPLQVAILVAAGLAGGTTNALAGGATFFTFPAMLGIGLAPVIANASNTVALWPASLVAVWAQGRRSIADVRRLLLPLAGVSVVGSAVGAFLLLHTSDRAFLKLVPFLLLVATALFAGSPLILRRLRARAPAGRVRLGPGKLAMMTVVALYGGYFGAGIGIMMMAGLSLAGLDDVRVANAVKNLLAGAINGVAVVIFVASGAVAWPSALVMLVGAVTGGALGGRLAGVIPVKTLRVGVIAIGSFLTVWYFWRAYG
jgi:uncharacterized membrane protein YfcA